MKKRVTVYVDGFNFYYGLVREMRKDASWKVSYWIDFVKLFEQFVEGDRELVKVVYFTASPLSPQKNARQSALFNANKLINGSRFEIIRGKYFEKQIICPYCKGAISKPEEKRTDVNISVRMIGDCVQDLTDNVILVSADSDLLPPVEFIQQNFTDKKVKVYFPPSSMCYDLQNNIIHQRGKIAFLGKNKQKFLNSVMPDIVESDDRRYSIPEEWKVCF